MLPLNGSSIEGDDDLAILGDYKPSDVKVQWAFLTITTFLFISSGGFLIFYFKEKNRKIIINELEEKIDEKLPRWKMNISIGLLCLLANSVFGILVLIGKKRSSY